jgi:hypothetical protein
MARLPTRKIAPAAEGVAQAAPEHVLAVAPEVRVIARRHQIDQAAAAQTPRPASIAVM